MDEESARRMLDEFKAQLIKNEDEREMLLSLIKGLEGWQRIHSTNGQGEGTTSPKGKTSLRAAVGQVLYDAQGEPLHVREILKRVLRMGAETRAKKPLGAIDLTCYSIIKYYPDRLEKVAPRTWRWARKN